MRELKARRAYHCSGYRSGRTFDLLGNSNNAANVHVKMEVPKVHNCHDPRRRLRLRSICTLDGALSRACTAISPIILRDTLKAAEVGRDQDCGSGILGG